jgi:hypothetical protein
VLHDRCFTLTRVMGSRRMPLVSCSLLNVAAVGYGARGRLTLCLAGPSRAATSTLNFDTHAYAIANSATIKLDARLRLRQQRDDQTGRAASPSATAR